jgi:hypothetical protein
MTRATIPHPYHIICSPNAVHTGRYSTNYSGALASIRAASLHALGRPTPLPVKLGSSSKLRSQREHAGFEERMY